MQWLGKAVGGLLGAFGGPVGSLIGVLIGHQWDQTVGAGRGQRSVQAISRLFFEVAFEVMGAIAKVDGRVSEDEIRIARRIMHGMRLGDAEVKVAIEHFTRGKTSGYEFDTRLAELASELKGRTALSRAFVQIQLLAAVGVGAIGAEKRQALWRVANALGVTRAELAQIEAIVRGVGGSVQPTAAESLAEAHRVLGVSAEASNDEVKTAYRRLMNQHHPDKLVARGLPQSMIGVAEQKTHEVRAAYEKIKTQRGFK
jgi:DnaJ like chaperone protein